MPANPDFNEIVTTTLKKRRKKLADNVLNHNSLLRRLNAKGNVQTVDGGETLVEELEYAENATFKYYSGYELLDMNPSEAFSAAEFAWKQAAVVVTASGLELRKNSGSERTIALLEKRMKNAEKTLMNQLSTGIYSNGTGAGGKQIGGLQLLVADDPSTGMVGGINRANFAFWKNSTSGDISGPSASNIQGHMQTRWLTLVRGGDRPDMIVADPVFFGYFWNSLLEIQRITQADKGESGFSSIAFHGPGGSAPVFHDDAAPSNHMYMLNTDFLFWRVHRDANFEPLARRDSFNQDAIAVPVIWMGNLTMSNASLQGVLWT